MQKMFFLEKASFLWFYDQLALLVTAHVYQRNSWNWRYFSILPNLILEVDTLFTSGALAGAVFCVALPAVKQAIIDGC